MFFRFFSCCELILTCDDHGQREEAEMPSVNTNDIKWVSFQHRYLWQKGVQCGYVTMHCHRAVLLWGSRWDHGQYLSSSGMFCVGTCAKECDVFDRTQISFRTNFAKELIWLSDDYRGMLPYDRSNETHISEASCKAGVLLHRPLFSCDSLVSRNFIFSLQSGWTSTYFSVKPPALNSKLWLFTHSWNALLWEISAALRLLLPLFKIKITKIPMDCIDEMFYEVLQHLSLKVSCINGCLCKLSKHWPRTCCCCCFPLSTSL